MARPRHPTGMPSESPRIAQPSTPSRRRMSFFLSLSVSLSLFKSRVARPGTPRHVSGSPVSARPPEHRAAGEVVGPSPARGPFYLSAFLCFTLSLSLHPHTDRMKDRQREQGGGGGEGKAAGTSPARPWHVPGTPRGTPHGTPPSSPRITKPGTPSRRHGGAGVPAGTSKARPSPSLSLQGWSRRQLSAKME